MYFITFLALLILLLAVLLVVYPVKISGVFNSEHRSDMHIIISWLNPFLKGFITNQDGHIALTIDLFNKRVLEKHLTPEKNAMLRLEARNYMDYISMARSLKINYARICGSYGFSDPAATGMLYGVIGIISQYIEIDELDNNADFLAVSNYFNILVEAEINAMVSFLRILGRSSMYHSDYAVGNRNNLKTGRI